MLEQIRNVTLDPWVKYPKRKVSSMCMMQLLSCPSGKRVYKSCIMHILDTFPTFLPFLTPFPFAPFDFIIPLVEKLKSNGVKFKVDIFPSEMFGHGIINVLPVYYNETSESKRKKAEDSELQELQEKLTNQKIKEEIIIEAEKPKKIYKFPRRIP